VRTLIVCLCMSLCFALSLAAAGASAAAPTGADAQLPSFLLNLDPAGNCPQQSQTEDLQTLFNRPRAVDTLVDCDNCPNASSQCDRNCWNNRHQCVYSCQAHASDCSLASCICLPC
jgi:hypothetical protein